MTSTTQPSLPWFRRHRLALLGWGGIALLLLLLLAFGQLQRHLTQRKIDTKLAAIRAQGLPTTQTELNTFYTPVPDADNAGLLFSQIRRHIIDWPHDAPWIGFSSNSILFATNPITVTAKTVLNGLISSNQTALQLIHQAAAKPKSRYPMDFSQGSQTSFMHLFESRKALELLRLESMHHLAEKRDQQALFSVEVSLRVAKSLDQEPLLISFLVRNAYVAITLNGLEQLLGRNTFAAPNLLRLQEMLLETEHRTNLRRVLHGERAFVVGSWNEPVSQIITNTLNLVTPFDTWPEFMKDCAWQAYEHGGYKEADLLNFLAFCDELDDVTTLSPSAGLAFGETLETKLNSTSKPSMDNIFTTQFANLIPDILKKQATAYARLRVAQTALAIERYRMENQRLPQTLGELIPQHLKSAPLDPFTEAPLLYRITETGFRVYSVGENGLDDGGLSRDEALAVQKKSDDILFTVERVKTP